MSTPNYDLDAFLEAATAADLDDGIVNATCHFSAVNVRDWEVIQERLASLPPETASRKEEEQ